MFNNQLKCKKSIKIICYKPNIIVWLSFTMRRILKQHAQVLSVYAKSRMVCLVCMIMRDELHKRDKDVDMSQSNMILK